MAPQIDHPQQTKEIWRSVVSIQRKRAVIACFRQTSLHMMPRYLVPKERHVPSRVPSMPCSRSGDIFVPVFWHRDVSRVNLERVNSIFIVGFALLAFGNLPLRYRVSVNFFKGEIGVTLRWNEAILSVQNLQVFSASFLGFVHRLKYPGMGRFTQVILFRVF